MKALIIDDEMMAVKLLEMSIRNYCPLISSVIYTTSPEEGLALIKKEKPEILFLDINMPGFNGLDLVEGIGANSSMDIIIVSGHSEHALRAIRLSVFDYLVKPVNIPELVRVVKKIEDKRALRNQANTDTTKNGKIALQLKDGIQFIDIKDIIMVEASGSYSIVHFANKTNTTITKNLKQIEQLLLKYNFFRPHRSYLINLNSIMRYKPLKDGGLIYLTNGSEIELSRTQKNEFNELMERNSLGKI